MGETTFYMQVYLETDHGRLTLDALRHHFPRTRIIVFSDGGEDRRGDLTGLDVEYIYSPKRTFTEGCLAPKLMLELFLEKPSSHLIKLDPDTVIHRPFISPLPEDCVFGTIQFPDQPDESIQGGCMGFGRSAAEAILSSGLLLDPVLGERDYKGNDPHLRHLADRWKELGLGSFDWSIAWACRILDIPLRSYSDVLSVWQRSPRVVAGRYAMTHPREDKAEISIQWRARRA